MADPGRVALNDRVHVQYDARQRREREGQAGLRLDRIDYSNGDARTFKFDLAGRCEWEKLNSVLQRSFAWTADSRLASLTATTGNETYTYSAFGTRAKVGTRTFQRAGAGVTASVFDDGNAKYAPGISELRGTATTYSHSGLKHMGAQTDAPMSGSPARAATRLMASRRCSSTQCRAKGSDPPLKREP